MTKFLFFAGSNGVHSVNAKLALAAQRLAEEKGVQTTFFDTADYTLPLYDPDIEANEGFPEQVLFLKTLFQSHDGVYIASPEYNGSFTPLLKNMIDWVSRVRDEGEPPLAAFKNKVYAIGSASPGRLGGIRGLVQLRMLLGHIDINVVPKQLALGDAYNAFDEAGHLKDPAMLSLLDASVDELIKYASAS